MDWLSVMRPVREEACRGVCRLGWCPLHGYGRKQPERAVVGRAPDNPAVLGLLPRQLPWTAMPAEGKAGLQPIAAWSRAGGVIGEGESQGAYHQGWCPPLGCE